MLLEKYTPTLKFHILLHVTFFYILGIFLHAATMGTTVLTLCTCLAATLLFVPSNITLRNNMHFIALPALLIIASFAGKVLITQQKNTFNLFYTQIQSAPLALKGTVTSIIATEQPRFETCITLDVTHMQRDSTDWVPLAYTIQIYSHYGVKELQVGDTISLTSPIFKKASKASFDDYLIKEGIAATIFMQKIPYELVHRPKTSLSRWLFYVRQNIITSLKNKISPLTLYVFASVFLGNKNTYKKYKEPIRDTFATWGLSHYLARSGLHMVMIIAMWSLLLQGLPLPCNAKHTILLLLGIIYAILSWPSVSFNRAFLTFLLYKTCTLLRIPSNLLHLLTVVCLITLICNPMQLFFLDFQLSFGLTFALALFNYLQSQTKLVTANC
jgi:ComEC/Rec2-related protein